MLDMDQSLHYCRHAPSECSLCKSVVAVAGVISTPSVLRRERNMTRLERFSELRSHLHFSRLLRRRARLLNLN